MDAGQWRRRFLCFSSELEHLPEGISVTEETVMSSSAVSCFCLSTEVQASRGKGNREDGRLIARSPLAYKENNLPVAKVEMAMDKLPKSLLLSTWLAIWELSWRDCF